MLVRERVLEHTRVEFGLSARDVDRARSRFAGGGAFGLRDVASGPGWQRFVGRVLSDQNLLVAAAGSRVQRVSERQARAVGSALVECLDLIDDRASPTEWAIASRLFTEFQRKLVASF